MIYEADDLIILRIFEKNTTLTAEQLNKQLPEYLLYDLEDCLKLVHRYFKEKYIAIDANGTIPDVKGDVTTKTSFYFGRMGARYLQYLENNIKNKTLTAAKEKREKRTNLTLQLVTITIAVLSLFATLFSTCSNKRDFQNKRGKHYHHRSHWQNASKV